MSSKRNEHLTARRTAASSLSVALLHPVFIDPGGAFSKYDPGKHIARYLRFENGKAETIALPGKDERKEFQEGKARNCCHKP